VEDLPFALGKDYANDWGAHPPSSTARGPLHAIARALDDVRSAKILPPTKQKLIRAIEICLLATEADNRNFTEPGEDSP